MKTLIGGYKHDDSMCTVCIQPKPKQRFSTVPVKCTTKLLHLNIAMCAIPSLHWPWKTIDTTYYSSTTTQSTHWYNYSQICKPRPAPPPSCNFRGESTQGDTKLSNSCALMDRENTKLRSFVMSMQPAVLYTKHALHSCTIRTVLVNEWSIQLLKLPRR